MSAHVYNQLKARILDGSYASGDRLNVDELARQLNASKTPVREALAQLASESLVVFRPRSGWSVPSLSLDEFVNFLEMQYALRVFVSVNLMEYIDRLDFGLLDSINTGLQARMREFRYHEVIQQNDLFHQTIFNIHPNRLILDRLEELDALIRLQRVRFFEREHQYFLQVAQRANTMHSDLLDALKKRDPELFIAISKNHHASTLNAYKEMSRLSSCDPESVSEEEALAAQTA
ncbi:MAG: GntR family transcriptional regulator [Candidatus Adiutrix sp.]|nr:GntR family transcriptional regulator [Candidatus Adiutrix sp.]